MQHKQKLNTVEMKVLTGMELSAEDKEDLQTFFSEPLAAMQVFRIAECEAAKLRVEKAEQGDEWGVESKQEGVRKLERAERKLEKAETKVQNTWKWLQNMRRSEVNAARYMYKVYWEARNGKEYLKVACAVMNEIINYGTWEQLQGRQNQEVLWLKGKEAVKEAVYEAVQVKHERAEAKELEALFAASAKSGGVAVAAVGEDEAEEHLGAGSSLKNEKRVLCGRD